MSLRNLAIVLIVVLIFAGCANQSQRAQDLSWNKKAIADAGGDFHFAVVSDNAGGMRPGVFKDAMAKLNLLQPAFVMCVGDLVEGYAESEADCQTMFDELAGNIGSLDAPFFGAVGNHDVSNDMMRSYVERRFGRTYYSFVYKGVLFLVLDSQQDPSAAATYNGGFSDAEVAFVEKTLRDNSGVRWTFAFMHQPLFDKPGYANVKGWDRIEKALEGRRSTVFAGHWHEYAKYEVGRNSWYRLATTGGDTKLTGADRGEFDEIVWVTMSKDGPRIANLDLSGIYRDDVSTDQTTMAYKSIQESTVAKPAALIADSALFSGGKTTLEVKNDTNFPLVVKATIESSAPLTVTPTSIDVTAKPHSVMPVELTLMAAQPTDPSLIAPAVVRWSARYDVPGRKAIEGTGSATIMIDGLHHCPKASAPVKLDGDLSEWGTLRESFTMPMQFAANASLWTGPEDASAHFSAAYDDKYVYLAFAVTDDLVVVNKEHKARQEDCLCVYIDARPADVRATSARPTPIMVVIAPGPKPGEETLGDPLPEGAKAVSVITATGYNTEIAIPSALLDKVAGGDWKDFRLNIRLHDLDDPAAWNATIMWWRPAWDGPMNCPGSGTFKKE
jgi:hypothetical protein